MVSNRSGYVISAVTTVMIIIAACAKVSTPSGGPRDRMPPVVLNSIPQNGARNFKGNKIVVTFDEYVALDKITEKFMVSPPMAKKPLVEIRGKNLIISYQDILHDSTTYTFYFQDAVRDLNEGNILDNYQFFFSTGSVIDSLSVTGNIYSALTLKPPENTLVLLYRDPDLLGVTKHLPDYISKADSKGYFRIDNIRPGKYLLYALKDADNSKNFNLPDEEMAFLEAPIEVIPERNYLPVKKDTVKPKPVPVSKTAKPGPAAQKTDTITRIGEYKLILFKPEKKQHYLTSSSRDLPYMMLYTLSLPPDTMKFRFTIPEADPKSYFIEKSRQKDTIRVWITDSSLYSRQQITTFVNYPFTDTTGKVYQKDDTVLMRFLAPRTPKGRPRKESLRVSYSITGGLLKPGQNIVLRSQTPFRSPDTSKIRLYEGDAKSRKRIPFLLQRDSTNSCMIRLAAKLTSGKGYLFTADSAAFGNMYGLSADSTGFSFSVGKDENYGKLILNISNFEGDRIIQILDNSEKVLRESRMQKNGKTEFALLDKGKYKLRVIYDLNGDGKWTTGDYLKGREPEPVSYYPKEIDISPNFEVTEDWNIGSKNERKLKSQAN